MPPYLATDDLKKLFVPAGSAFITFLLWIIFQYVFKLDFQCPCDPKENTWVCVVYMLIPAISLFIVVIIANKHIRTIVSSKGTGIQCKSIIILMPIIKAISVACLWVIAVLTDGDWYVCLKTANYSLPPYEQSFCKNIKTPAEDADIRTKKTKSREIAIWVLFAVSLIWALFLAIRQSRYMRPLTYQYNTILLEKTDLYIAKELKKLAEDKAKTRGLEQINNIQLFLQRTDAETHQQQPEGDPSGISRSTSQAASNQANPEKLDTSSDTFRHIPQRSSGKQLTIDLHLTKKKRKDNGPHLSKVRIPNFQRKPGVQPKSQ